jgi:hypothetical protein
MNQIYQEEGTLKPQFFASGHHSVIFSHSHKQEGEKEYFQKNQRT